MSSKIVVTGTSAGIGLAVARRLLENSHEVIGISRRTSDELNQHFANRFTQEIIDLSEPVAVQERFPILVKRHADVNAIVFCAGYGRFGSLEEFSYDQIARMVNTNLLSTMYLARAFLPQMKRKLSGKLIFIGSESVLSGGRRGAVYTATKSALDGFVKSLRRECSSDGIHAGIVTLGMVKTEFYEQAQFTHGESGDNFILPEDVAEAVAMMLESRPGTVIDEVRITPLKSVITRRRTD
ncbi:MAG: SDR family NAD(P)-dependent oxidoreductase [Acidiferrobacterales bacterium]|nr:SDR family NAD(P)-dependent oxidoreductase [Acidiferrobacterales bacterium]